MAETNDKWAVQVIEKNALGQDVASYIDANTGSLINNLQDYNIVNQNDVASIGSYDSANNPFAGYFDSNTDGTNRYLTDFKPQGKAGARNEGSGSDNTIKDFFDPKGTPTASNNFRYVDKPSTALAAASMVPGFLGMAAKAVGVGMGVQNTAATGAARQYMGLEPNYVSNGMKNIVGDQNGFVGNVKIGEKVYGVGLGAEDPNGRTTLTPDEARKRALTQGVDIVDATKDESKTALKSFKANNELTPTTSELSKNIFNGSMAAAETSRAVTRSPNNPNYDLAVGMGLGDLPARQMAEVNYSLEGKGRSEIPSSGIGNKVADVVTDVLGPDYKVNVTSGQEPAGRSPLGTANRHPLGFAADLEIQDPAGRVLSLSNPDDAKAIQDVAQGFAARYNGNFGMGPEYMGNSTMHMDTMDLNSYPGGAQWGSTGYGMAGKLNEARATKTMPDSYYNIDNPPTPADKPVFSANPNEIAMTTDPLATMSAQQDKQPLESLDSIQKGFETKLGIDRFKDITPEEKSLMATTLAGEIDTRKTDLSTPEGQKEAQGILSTMENRLGKYGSIEGVVNAPKQYSTWSNEAAINTAKNNYALNQKTYDSLVDSYISDPTQNLGFTSYHANTVNPGWSNSMTDSQQIGAHTFGSLPEYTAKSVTQGAQDYVAPTTAFNTQASTSPTVNSGVDTTNSGFAGMPDKTQDAQSTASDSSSSTSSGQSEGSGQSTSNDKSSGGFASSPDINSSESPDDRDNKNNNSY